MDLESVLRKSWRFTKDVAKVGSILLITSCGGDKPTEPIKPPITEESNRPPAITAPLLREVNEQFNYRSQIKASDPDGDKLTYTILGPKELSVDADGRVTGVFSEVSKDSIVVVTTGVSDGKLTDEQTDSIKINNVSNVYVSTEESPEKIMNVDNGRITFSSLPSVEVGDIISSESEEVFLRKIESISGNTVYTSQATIAETMKRGSFHFNANITPDKINQKMARKGVKFFQTPLFDLGLELGEEILREKGLEGIIESARIGTNLGVELGADVEDMELKSFLFSITASGEYDLKINSSSERPAINAKVSFDDIVPIPAFTIGYIPAGPIPVPLRIYPEAGFDVGVKGHIGKITSRVSQKASFTLGLKYENGNWSSIMESDNDFENDPLSVDSKDINFRVFAGPSLAFLVYKIAGPYGSIPGFLGFESDQKKWLVGLGLEALLGVEMEIFSKRIVDYSKSFEVYKRTIAEGEFAVDVPDTIEVPSDSTRGDGGGEGGDGGTGSSERIRLTFDTELESWPRISPDGSKIVFSREGEIYVINSDGSSPRVLAKEKNNYFQPSWSSDGRKIIFISRRESGQNNLYVANLEGNVSIKSLPTSRKMVSYFPEWSPDEEKILFNYGYVLGDLFSYEGAKVSAGIAVVNSDGTNLKYLTERRASFQNLGLGSDKGPIWLDEGQRIVYSSRDGQKGIYVMDSDGSEQRRVLEGLLESGNAFPRINPGRKEIIFINDAGDFEVANMDGTNRRFLGSYEGFEDKTVTHRGMHVNSGYDIFPDGKRMVMPLNINGDTDLYIVPIDP